MISSAVNTVRRFVKSRKSTPITWSVSGCRKPGTRNVTKPDIPWILKGLAAAVDFFAPEGYGRFNDQYKGVRTGVFTVAYARSMAKKPVFWAEYGKNIWSGSNFTPSEILLQYEQAGYENFLRMICDSQSQGWSGMVVSGRIPHRGKQRLWNAEPGWLTALPAESPGHVPGYDCST